MRIVELRSNTLILRACEASVSKDEAPSLASPFETAAAQPPQGEEMDQSLSIGLNVPSPWIRVRKTRAGESRILCPTVR